MTHASLFSGIGGPEVAAAMMGWNNVFHCEINPFCRSILEFWFPNSDSYDDITKTDFSKYRGRIDVLTGGFPCQPFSYAGKRGGQSDERYLWPEMLRVIFAKWRNESLKAYGNAIVPQVMYRIFQCIEEIEGA